MLDAPINRVCRVCKRPKVFSDFHADRSNSLGIQYVCKECSKLRAKKYAKDHPEYFKEKGKERYNPTENPRRYQKTRDNFLARASAYRATPRGKLMGLLSTAKKRAAKSGKEFELTIEWAVERFEAQSGVCLLTRIPFVLERGGYNERFHHPYAPSLDRIDSGGGYTIANTRLVCTIVNLALNRFGDEALRRMCEGYISTNQPRSERSLE